jgi:hypothetical protein
LLHLDDEFISLVRGAPDVEPGGPRVARVIEVLGVLIDDVVDLQPFFEYVLQQADQKFFPRFRSEEVFKAVVAFRIDELNRWGDVPNMWPCVGGIVVA